MPLRERLPTAQDPVWEMERICAFAATWGIDTRLAARLTNLSRRLPFPLLMISGSRTRAEQEGLAAEGRPAAPYDLSTHAATDAMGCPRWATGADVSPSVAHVASVKAHVGRAAAEVGLRWGGGSLRDSEGFPVDWQHVDLGPR